MRLMPSKVLPPSPAVLASERKRFWAHAAAFGALWGTVEVTLGSFLHTLRLPLSGAVLASLAAGLLVAQRQIFSQRGSSAATAVVAALCKSISPGGVILGPMVGITVEGLLVELALLVVPGALPSVVLAGALCALWATLQKLLTQYLLYGGSILELYGKLITQAGVQIGWPDGGWWALATLGVLLTLMGGVGAWLGRSIGLQVRGRLTPAAAGERTP